MENKIIFLSTACLFRWRFRFVALCTWSFLLEFLVILLKLPENYSIHFHRKILKIGLNKYDKLEKLGWQSTR